MSTEEEVPAGGTDPEGSRKDARVILRVGGLRADVVAEFSSDLCVGYLWRVRDVEAALADARRALQEQLYEAVHNAPARQRRVLLSLKRDNFNSRNLRKFLAEPFLEHVPERVRTALERVVELEMQLALHEAEFERIYLSQRIKESERLFRLADVSGFSRGLALGSPVFAATLTGSRQTTEVGRFRRCRAEMALLRYVSRTGLKLSPFSSLTRVGLGRIGELEAAPFQVIGPQRWQERSCVRLQRFLADQLVDLLLRYQPFRDNLMVSLNESIEQKEDFYRLIRPGRWYAESTATQLAYCQPAIVRTKLKGPVIAWILTKIGRESATYRDLESELEASFPSEPPARLHELLERLSTLGLFCFKLPFASSDLQWEGELLSYLESLLPIAKEDTRLHGVIACLRQILHFLTSFATSESPVSLLAAIRNATGELFGLAAQLGGLDPKIALSVAKDHIVYEDVFLASDRQGGEISDVSCAAAAEIARSLLPLVRISVLNHGRHEFLHTLAAFAETHWSGRGEVDFLEFFETTLPIFQEFVRFQRSIRNRESREAVAFNPFELQEILQLAEYRLRLRSEFDDLCQRSDQEFLVDIGALNGLLDSFPRAYTQPREFCAFLQPVSEEADLWVLNMLTEGSGRMSSRYTAVMDEGMRRSFVSRYIDESVFRCRDQRVELVDLLCPTGHMGNIHEPMTRRVLEIPGHPSGLPAERCLQLKDLKIRLVGGNHPPQLMDLQGNLLWPVHLGAVISRHLPSIAKFLAIFGPGDLRRWAPQRKQERICEHLSIIPRHRIGNVFYQRKSWVIGLELLRELQRTRSKPVGFSFIDRWRRDLGLPERVFVSEPLSGQRRKPQYVDFTSCLFVALFLSIIKKVETDIRIVEALPRPCDLPLTGGSRWAVELQIESTMLRDRRFRLLH